MSIRNLDNNHDWVFGSGRSDYLTEQDEIRLNIETRVLSFLGDCFFATNEGIDYWNLLNIGTQDELENQIYATIVDTPGVVRVDRVDIILSSNRQFTLDYSVYTIYSKTIESSVLLNRN